MTFDIKNSLIETFCMNEDDEKLIPENDTITLKVSSLAISSYHHITTSKYATVSNLLRAISNLNHYPLETMRLLFEGRPLLRNASLFDYGVSDGDVVYCVPQKREPPQYLPISFQITVQSSQPQIVHYRQETRDLERQLSSMRMKVSEIQELASAALQRITMTQNQMHDIEKFKHDCRLVQGKLVELLTALKENGKSLHQYRLCENNENVGASFRRIGEFPPPPTLTRDALMSNITSGLGELFGATPGSNLVPHTEFHFPDPSPEATNLPLNMFQQNIFGSSYNNNNNSQVNSLIQYDHLVDEPNSTPQEMIETLNSVISTRIHYVPRESHDSLTFINQKTNNSSNNNTNNTTNTTATNNDNVNSNENKEEETVNNQEKKEEPDFGDLQDIFSPEELELMERDREAIENNQPLPSLDKVYYQTRSSIGNRLFV